MFTTPRITRRLARVARSFATEDMSRTLSRTRSGDHMRREAHKLKRYFAGRGAVGSQATTGVTHSVQGVHHVCAVPRGPNADPHLENTMVVGAACFSVFSGEARRARLRLCACFPAVSWHQAWI